MNVRFTLLILCLACYSNLLAQPANDECTGAQTLNLGTPSPCPLSFPVTNTFMSNNINATSTVPYPQFTGCNPGGSTTGPAAEVWYTFTATSNQISITVSGGLAVPNIVLFTGPNCFALNPEVCARGTGNTVTLTASVTAGTTYYMLISGGDVTDQGNFTISIQSSRDCSPCVTGDALVPMPPPQNGTYASNQVVNFCYTMLNWDVTGTVEWFHAIQVQLGPGWDASTLTPTMAPPSCDGTGIWLWFDSWTSCATGQTWGPGYAYESGAGIGCGGSPIDGDPGNNWGDGNGTCAAIGSTAPPKTFCFSVQVADCLSGGNFNGNDLSVTIFPLSDGQSGSWTQVGCNSGTSYNFLASAICCDDLDPVVTDFELSSCAASCDGSITFIGGGDSQPGDSWTYLVFDQFNNVVGNFNIPSSDYQTLTGLCPGSYSIQAVNAISGCTRSETFNLGVEPPFFAIANYTPVCPGEPLQVFGSADLSGDTEIYTWTGPGGITVQGQDAILPFTGIWTLNVTVDGCPATPDMVDVQYVQTNTSALANPDEVCAGDPINLQASGGVFYDWGAEGIGASITTFAPNVASPQTITYSVTISTAQGCDVVEEVMVLVNPLPEAEIIGPTDACQDETVILTAVGGVDFEWSTSGDDFIEAVTLTAADAPIASYSVTVTDLNGCMDDAQWSILVNPPPAAMASANPETVCAGQSTQLTATGGLFYDWSTSQTGATITITPAASDIIEVTVTDANECRAVAEVAVFVDQPIAAPVVQCGTVTPSSVQFTWGAVTGATAYQVVVTTSQGGTLSGTTYTVNGLSPGELVTIQVTAVGTNSCPNPTTTFSCNALSCPPVTVTINTVAPICLTAGSPVVNLTANIAGNTMAGTTTWSGTGITNTATGTFDPNVAGVGAHTVTATYTEGLCTYTDDLVIQVFQTPTANFSINDTDICETESVTVTYTGNASAGANFNWNFGGGTAVPGTGIGPHTVTWTTGGSKTITLTVSENGCSSTTASQMVQVQDELASPVISCGTATTSSVTFNWASITGATGYTVNVLTGQSGTQAGNSYTVTGLMPGELVTIQVTALNSGPCGPSNATFSCNAANCPVFQITIPDFTVGNNICLVPTSPNVTLTASVTGGAGGGTGVWSGPGIINASAGTFSPVAAGLGTHTITFTYSEGACSASATTTINVLLTPIASFSVESPICITESSTLVYTGNASPAAFYSWDFGGGTAVPGGNGPGPQEVNWPTAGTKTLVLNVTQGNCASEEFIQTVVVEPELAAPSISCNTTTSSVEFTWPNVTGASSYNVTVLSGPSGIQSGNSYLVTGLNPGTSVEIQVEAVGTGACGSSFATAICTADDCPNVTITIDPIDPICLDGAAAVIDLEATVSGSMGTGSENWSGTGIINMATGLFDPIIAGAGFHTITFSYEENNCSYDSSIDIVVNPQPNATITVDSPICITQTSTVTYTGGASPAAMYSWNFDGGIGNPGAGVGPHEISWPSVGGKTITLTVTEANCTSEPFSQSVTVESELIEPDITCTTTTSTVEFSWADVPGAISYNVTVLSGPAGVLSGNSYLVSGLNPGDMVEIQVEAVGTGPCGSSFATANCVAQDCPTVNIDIDNVVPICLNAAAAVIDLEAALTGASGAGSETWSGNGITNASMGLFDPNAAGSGTHTINYTYQEGNCTYNSSITIVVNPQPTADFTVDSPICITESSTVTFTGNAGGTASYSWTFDGGTAMPGVGVGPHEVSWSSTGTKNITLVVTENNCASEIVTQSVLVEAELADPVINCNTTTSTVEFVWMDVPGAVSYNVVVLSGATGTLNGNSYLVSGLTPGDMVEIEVEAVGTGACGSSFATAICTAQDCPAITIDIAPVNPICLDNTAAVVDLEAVLTGASGAGSETWSGNGITNASMGLFDPNAAGPGTHTINYTYQEGNCTYNSSITIVVNPQPTADFTVDSPICITESSTVTFTGNAGGTAIFDWEFNGGVANPGTGEGPHEVSWANAGSKTITLVVTENDCASEPLSQIVEVQAPIQAPVVSCETDNTSIIFSWNPVAGATAYQVVDITGPTGVLSGTTYTVTGLSPGTEVTIQVIAETDNLCGNVSTEQSCIALDCPDVVLDISAINPLCIGDAPVNLIANASGGVGGGTFAWSGVGVVGNTFDPALVPSPGDYTVSVEYTEGVCVFTESATITVNGIPESSFAVESPVCINEPATITYTGDAGSIAIFTWNFGGGTAIPGTGIGPHEVSWSAAGVQTISLVVEQNGCTPAPSSATVTVESPLNAPIISCETTSTSIVFSWNPIAGATTYQVDVLSGMMGTLSGTTYTVTGLNPGDEVEIMVTAIGSGPCGNSSSSATCIAQDCPSLSVDVSGPTAICSGDDLSFNLNINASTAGPFTVTYTLNGAPNDLIAPAGASVININEPVSANTTLVIESVIDNSLPSCIYPGNATWTVQIDAPNNAGTALPGPAFCEGTGSVINLADLLSGADVGGLWSESSTPPSTGGAFNAAAGTFNPVNQAGGTYTFTYTADNGGVCPTDEQIVNVTVIATPVADAGADQELTCNMGMVSLGGSGTTTGVSYEWIGPDGTVIVNPDQAFIEVGQPGVFTLTVTNAAGCTASDAVTVTANLEIPTFSIEVSQISCFQADDGAISINDITGGTPPYSISLNGGTPTNQTFFTGLGAANYSIIVTDQNGCNTEIMANLEEPEEVVVVLSTNLEGENVIQLGDSILLTAVFNPGLDIQSIVWQPDSIGLNNEPSVWVSPEVTSSFSVTISDANNCSDSDNTTIIVEKNRPVFLPNVFSPNDDGRNDVFFVQAGDAVKAIKSFQIFSRWGESVFAVFDFQPNDPDYGWDGTYRGSILNAAVFVYYVEVEFIDGEVKLYKGDVTLLR